MICEWEPDMNHTDQIAKLLERLFEGSLRYYRSAGEDQNGR